MVPGEGRISIYIEIAQELKSEEEYFCYFKSY